MQNSWLKYSGMAIQLVVFLLIGYWLGSILGSYVGWKKGNGELLGMLFFLITGVYKLVRDVLQENS